MTIPPLRSTTAALADAIAPAGLRIADLGCGDGALARWLASQGAAVLAVDPQAALLTARPPPGPLALAARAECLPLAPATLDLAVFSNALHHLAKAAMAPALDEVWRCLRPGGRLAAIEPLAEGAYFDLLRPVEDETELRAAALATLRRAEADGRWRRVGEWLYRQPLRFADAEAWLVRLIAAEPTRAGRVATLRDRLIGAFDRAATRDAEGRACFAQPMRFTLLQKV